MVARATTTIDEAQSGTTYFSFERPRPSLLGCAETSGPVVSSFGLTLLRRPEENKGENKGVRNRFHRKYRKRFLTSFAFQVQHAPACLTWRVTGVIGSIATLHCRFSFREKTSVRDVLHRPSQVPAQYRHGDATKMNE